jgi:hypothetical protein
MNYLHSDLGSLRAGQVVQARLRGTEANVFLVDPMNLANYRNGRDYRYFGGHFKNSPCHVTVPHDGHWRLIIDLGGFGGQVQAEVSVLAA